MSSFYRRHHKGILITVFVFLGLILALYILAPYLTKRFLNERILDDLGQYEGYVQDVDLQLLRGGARLTELEIWKKDGDRELPLVFLKESTANMSWSDLFRGRLAVKLALEEPEMNFLDAEKKEDKQTGRETDWSAVMEAYEDYFPFVLHELRITNGKVNFKNYDKEPNVDLKATDIDVVMTNLTNIRDIEGERVASFEMTATLFDEASALAKARFDPYDYNDFDFASEIEDIHLNKINDFTKAYASLDFTSGHGDVLMEIKAEDGDLTGYIKPLFEEIEILNYEQDIERQDDNPLQIAWEGVTNFFKTVFLNKTSEKIATEIEIEGTLDEVKVDTWGAVAGVVKNAFSDAVKADFENLTPLTGGGASDEEEGG